MDKNFKCKSCGIVFTADDSGTVICPSCNSDNLDYYKQKQQSSSIWLWAGIAFIVAIAAGIGAKFLFSGSSNPVVSIENEGPDTSNTITITNEEGQAVEIVDPILEPILTFNNDLKANPINKTYSFSFHAENLPENAKVEYILKDYATGKEVMKSDNGKFSNVPPATDETGSYTVEMIARQGDQEVKASNVITGCEKFPEVTLPKLTTAQVQALIDKMISGGNSAVISSNQQIDKHPTLRFQGLRDDDVAPTNISKLLSQVTMGIWSGMKVISVGYDEETNKVNQIVIQPVYAD